ncbi:MAG: hypothetical protein QMC93_01730 [Patescibacteria group bacterium]|nr:hypothetical protein [Patescibacteria group bacterium]
MANFSKDFKKGEAEEPKKERISEEVLEKWFPKKPRAEIPEEKREALERKELTLKEKEKREKLREEIKKTKLPPEKKVEAEKEAERIKRQTVQRKIKHLLDLAQQKGLPYAIEVAEDLKDPYLLDLFHDILAEEGLFKKFLK